MTDRYIRAMLRAATAAGYLHGWQGPHTDARSYTIAPAVGDAHEATLSATIAYVELLQVDRLEPLYRRGEPAEF
jgi:hypothetical protein